MLDRYILGNLHEFRLFSYENYLYYSNVHYLFKKLDNK